MSPHLLVLCFAATAHLRDRSFQTAHLRDRALQTDPKRDLHQDKQGDNDAAAAEEGGKGGGGGGAGSAEVVRVEYKVKVYVCVSSSYMN